MASENESKQSGGGSGGTSDNTTDGEATDAKEEKKSN